jgi:hypothetical protein
LGDPVQNLLPREFFSPSNPQPMHHISVLSDHPLFRSWAMQVTFLIPQVGTRGAYCIRGIYNKDRMGGIIGELAVNGSHVLNKLRGVTLPPEPLKAEKGMSSDPNRLYHRHLWKQSGF